MNALTTPSERQSSGYSGQGELTIELAKMLALVAPSSMTAEQQEMWLRAAVDALEDIRADEVAHVSAEVRRSVTRHNQIIPEIAKRVAEHRAERSRSLMAQQTKPLPPAPPRPEPMPMTQAEIDRMPKWIKDIGLRVGFLKRAGDRIVEA